MAAPSWRGLALDLYACPFSRTGFEPPKVIIMVECALFRTAKDEIVSISIRCFIPISTSIR